MSLSNHGQGQVGITEVSEDPGLAFSTSTSSSLYRLNLCEKFTYLPLTSLDLSFLHVHRVTLDYLSQNYNNKDNFDMYNYYLPYVH